MLVTLDLPTELEYQLQTQATAERLPLNRYVEQTLITTLAYKPIVAALNQLPHHTLPELLTFINYLHFKSHHPIDISQAITKQNLVTLQELAAPSLLTLMDEMSDEAQANGLTSEILESILNEQ